MYIPDAATPAPISYEIYQHAIEGLRRHRQRFWYREPGLWLPLSCAIGLDTSTSGIVGVGNTTIIVPHTCTGSNLLLCSGLLTGATNSPSATYNGVPMTTLLTTSNNGYGSYLAYLLNPPVGLHDVVWTLGVGTSLLDVANASYTGVQQSGIPDASNTTTTTGVTNSTSVVPIADNCWIVGFGTGSAGSAMTVTGLGSPFIVDQEQHGPFDQILLTHLGPISPAALQVLDVNANAGASFLSGLVASFAPAVITPTSLLWLPQQQVAGGWPSAMIPSGMDN